MHPMIRIARWDGWFFVGVVAYTLAVAVLLGSALVIWR